MIKSIWQESCFVVRTVAWLTWCLQGLSFNSVELVYWLAVCKPYQFILLNLIKPINSSLILSGRNPWRSKSVNWSRPGVAKKESVVVWIIWCGILGGESLIWGRSCGANVQGDSILINVFFWSWSRGNKHVGRCHGLNVMLLIKPIHLITGILGVLIQASYAKWEFVQTDYYMLYKWIGFWYFWRNSGALATDRRHILWVKLSHYEIA